MSRLVESQTITDHVTCREGHAGHVIASQTHQISANPAPGWEIRAGRRFGSSPQSQERIRSATCCGVKPNLSASALWGADAPK